MADGSAISCVLLAFISCLNEVNAVCNAVFAVALLFMNKIYFPEIKLNALGIWLSVLSITISLAVNLYSGGYKMRMEGLPDFTLGQSLKNTAHTFLMPLIHYQYLPFILCALFIFFLFLKGGLDNFKQVISLSKKEIGQFVWVFSIVILSFFLHCYTLSDIVLPLG